MQPHAPTFRPRSRVRRGLAFVLALAAFALVVLIADPVPASAKTHAAPPPRLNGTPILNAPRPFSRQYASLGLQVEQAIKATRRGDTIRAAYYRFDLEGVSKQLIAAHRRGVSVQIVLNQPLPVNTGMYRELGRLAQVLGITPGAGSYVVSPASSGLRTTAGNMHAKFLTISRVGEQRYVSFVGSANLNAGNLVRAWNETQVVVGDKKIFRALNRYFEQIVSGRDLPRSPRPVTSHGLTLHFYPGAPNVIGRALAKVKPGRGCRLTIATYLWADNRLKDAKTVARLAEQGCAVRLMINDTPTTFGPRVAKVLRRSPVEIRNMAIRRKGVKTIVHAKTWVINGTVYAGSANTSEVTRRRNADVLTVRTSRDPAGKAVLAAYEQWLGQMWNVGQPLAPAPAPPVKPAGRR